MYVLAPAMYKIPSGAKFIITGNKYINYVCMYLIA